MCYLLIALSQNKGHFKAVPNIHDEIIKDRSSIFVTDPAFRKIGIYHGRKDWIKVLRKPRSSQVKSEDK